MTEPDSNRAPRGPDQGAPTVLILVRHGRTAFTEQRRFSGRGGVDAPLSIAGVHEAGRVADLLAGVGHPGLPGSVAVPDVGPVDVVRASPLLRTRQTAELIGAELGLSVEIDDGWIEAGFGIWDGLTYAETLSGWPELFRSWQGSTTVAPPGGESLDELTDRIARARQATVAAHPGRVVVVVTHATPVRAVVQEALDAGPSALWRTRVSPASATVLRYWADGGIELVAVNALY